MASSERTEAATPKRLEELRSRGTIPRSPDLNGAITLFAGFALLRQFGGSLGDRLHEMLAHDLSLAGQLELTESTVPHLAQTTVLLALGITAPLVLLLPAAGLIASIAQVGPAFTPRAAAPDLDRVNPLTGLKRLLSPRSLVELVKVIAKGAILAVVAGRAYTDHVAEMVALGSGSLGAAVERWVGIALDLGLTVSAVLVALAVLDYGYQRWEFQRHARMTREEVREEQRQTEGRPEIRSRIRSLQRRMARLRMMANVPKADVVIVNPSHYAVALGYRPGEMRAPRVLAKGVDLMAQRIRERARAHGVPIVENPPLAQTLYRTVEIGAEIPVSLFQAVAEVLAYIYRLRGRSAAVGPADG